MFCQNDHQITEGEVYILKDHPLPQIIVATLWVGECTYLLVNSCMYLLVISILHCSVIITMTPHAGEWRHGLRSGEGEYIAADGTSYNGKWAYDKVMM